MAYVQTIFPGFVPEGFFDNDNVEFIRNKVMRVLDIEFKQHIIVDRASVIRVMQRVLEERLEVIPKTPGAVATYASNVSSPVQLLNVARHVGGSSINEKSPLPPWLLDSVVWNVLWLTDHKPCDKESPCARHIFLACIEHLPFLNIQNIIKLIILNFLK